MWGVSPIAAQTTLGCRDTLGPQGPYASFPASGANGVTLDAPLRIRYTEGFLSDFDASTAAELLDVFSCTNAPCSESVEATGELSIVDDQLFFVPTPSWNPFTQYRGVARGTDRNLPFGFTTTSTVDQAPPAFSGGLSVNTEPTQDPCYREGDPGEPEHGYRVEVTFAPATDDGAPGDIEYQLFLTRGPGVEGATLVAQTRNFGATERVSLAFYIDEQAAEQTHCVDLIVIDGVGKVTRSRDAACFNATLGRDFVGCNVQSTKPFQSWPGIFVFGALAFILKRK